MKQEIINCLTWYANKVAETTQYTNWSDDFCRKEIKESTEKFINELKKHIDWDNLTVEEARELRFCRWDDDQPDLWLIPLWLLPIVPIGMELETIDGTKVIYDGTNVDNDIRFGCIAYGITIKEDEEND
jgi:hypothetical protein